MVVVAGEWGWAIPKDDEKKAEHGMRILSHPLATRAQDPENRRVRTSLRGEDYDVFVAFPA